MTVRQRNRRATVASWQDYFAAAQWLDALCAAPAGRRGTDDARADVASARAELAEVRAELARQRTALAGRGLLDATPAELAAARQEVSTDLASIREALHECRKLILATDALLTRDRTRRWSPVAVRLWRSLRRVAAALRRGWSAVRRSRALRWSLVTLRRMGAAVLRWSRAGVRRALPAALRWSRAGVRRALTAAVRAGAALRRSPAAVRAGLLVGCLVLVLALG